MDKPTELKRYLLFSGLVYYPGPGLDDLRATADTVEELQQWFSDNAAEIAGSSGYINNWAVIVEHQSMQEVTRGLQEDGPAEWVVTFGERPEMAVLGSAKGCRAQLAPGQHWAFCGETDMGQSLPALCTACGGEYRRADAMPKLEDAGRDIVLTMPEGGELISQLVVLDARPESLEFGIRYGQGIARLSQFAGWRFAR